MTPVRTHVLGIGASSSATAGEIAALVAHALDLAHLDNDDIDRVATIDALALDERVVALGWPVIGFRADELAAVSVPHVSERTRSAVATPSVAEAAALHASGASAELVLTKQKSRHATAAISRIGNRA